MGYCTNSELSMNSCEISLRRRNVGYLTSNKTLDFDADPDHDPGPGISTELFPLRDSANCENFAGLFAVSECFYNT